MDVASLFLQLEKGEGRLRDRAGDAASDGETSESRPAGISAPPPPISPPGVSRRVPPMEAALVHRRPDPDRRQVLSGLTAGSCQSCAGCSVRAAYARTAWLGLPQHRPGRGTELDAATPATSSPPQSSTRTRARTGRRLLWASGGRGILGRGYCRSTPHG